MKITNISSQVQNPDRVNVSIDGAYRFSLDIAQVIELGVRKGRELSEEELVELEAESQFGKLYSRTLEYCLMRPHSVREVRDYLHRKTLTRRIIKNNESKTKSEKKIIDIPGYSPALADRVLTKLQHMNYVNDEQFARWWVEARNQTKGTSLRKLSAELVAKGVSRAIIEEVMNKSTRTDGEELAKIIAKKRARYPDDQKFIHYLARRGFGYDDIKRTLDAASATDC